MYVRTCDPKDQFLFFKDTFELLLNEAQIVSDAYFTVLYCTVCVYINTAVE